MPCVTRVHGRDTRAPRGTLHLHGAAAVDELKSRGREASDSKVPPFPAGCILLADAPSEDGYLGRAPPRSPRAAVCVARIRQAYGKLSRFYRRGALYAALILFDRNECVSDCRTRYARRGELICHLVETCPLRLIDGTAEVADKACLERQKKKVFI